MKKPENEQPGGVSSPVVKEFSPNGYPYFITGVASKAVLYEFADFKDYIDYCGKIVMGMRKYFKFHPDPFKQ